MRTVDQIETELQAARFICLALEKVTNIVYASNTRKLVYELQLELTLEQQRQKNNKLLTKALIDEYLLSS